MHPWRLEGGRWRMGGGSQVRVVVARGHFVIRARD